MHTFNIVNEEQWGGKEGKLSFLEEYESFFLGTGTCIMLWGIEH